MVSIVCKHFFNDICFPGEIQWEDFTNGGLSSSDGGGVQTLCSKVYWSSSKSTATIL